MRIIQLKQWLLLLFIFVIWGCSPEKHQLPKELQKLENFTVYPADANPEKTTSFEKKVVYETSEEVLIGRIGDIAVDDSGRVFIADSQKKVIYVFEPGGRFMTQLGREGRGPSEFSEIKSLQIRKDYLYVYDPSQYKISVFKLDTLVVENRISLAENRREYKELAKAYPWIHKIYVRNDGTYIAQFISDSSTQIKKWQNVEMKGLFYLLDDDGVIESKLFELPSETRTQLGAFLYPIQPFFGNLLIALSSDNNIFLADPEHFVIKSYSPNGIYQQAFYYPHKKIPLTKKSAIEAKVPDMFIRNMKSLDLPPSWPVLTDLKIDDQDRLWIATTVEDMNVYEWWVLEKSGEMITKFEWPRDEPIEDVKNGYIYTRETGDKGIENIIKYEIQMEKE